MKNRKDEELVNKFEIIKQAFSHLHQVEDVVVDNEKAILYFPTIDVAIYETKHVKREKGITFNLEAYKDEEIGILINEILLEAEFIPANP
jgi:hypothetical protein